jgi:hypothetical protein
VKIFGLAILLLIFALPAHAQRGGASNMNHATEGGGGGGGASTGAGYTSSNHIAVTQFSVVTAHGSEDYVLTSYMSYNQAVEAGQAVLAYKAKTLGDLAREYREEKARKNELQDGTQQ